MMLKNKFLSIIVLAMISLNFSVYAKESDGSYIIEDETLNKKIKEYIINNPEIIIESLERYKKNKEEIITKKINSYIKENIKEIEDIKLSPYLGNPNGDVTMVMFFDYSCSYCKKENEIINQLLETDKNIKIIYKPYPIFGENSHYLTKIAIAVYLEYPDKFKEFHDEVMRLNQIAKDTIKHIFKKYNIEYSKIELAFSSQKLQEIQNGILSLGKNIYLSAVPTFIINGKIYKGMLRLNDIVAIIEEARSKK